MSTTDTATDHRDPAEIEREIHRTQEDMSRTVNRLGDQLTPRNLLDALLDKADENGIDARWALDGARRNPLALGMIALGGIWLISDSDARLSTFTGGERPKDTGENEWGNGWHRGYVAHMSAVERQPDEDFAAWRRRRDQARASYLMIEPRHDEDEASFGDRLDQATEAMRQQRDQWMQQARETGRQAKRQGSRIAGKAERAYEDNPLLGGLAAALLGAIAGSALPVTQTEREQLGRMGSKALDTIGETAREKKDELVDTADRAIRRAGNDSDGRAQPAH